MELEAFLATLMQQPEVIEFEQTMAVIDHSYDFIPTAFRNGETNNQAGENNGSCKIFAFASLNKLTPAQTLACFGRFYRQDVLEHPENTDHQNIRNFIKYGWQGIEFHNPALHKRI
ncbi:hypothetical protein VST7929_03157 [Vibrio stylophorae]|uniref:Type III effector n=1 Tax=Vibrio stylophorae TaxID=659351 RepID=A0ABN8DX18_9VIBR|nr:HopJ type III effector protein [Vibrio stylophorae]CAH0535644.1 hypothetical protein VST7929_03157 [Vibrio stylophorae]